MFDYCIFETMKFTATLSLLPVILLTVANLFGQGCVPAIRSNRNKTVRLLNNSTVSYSWTVSADPSLDVALYVGKEKADSVSVRRNGQQQMVLHANGFVLLDARYEEYDARGKVLRIDSLRPGSPTNTIYLDLLHGHVFVRYDYHPNGLPSKRVLKALNGTDSLTETWSVKGLLLTRVTSDHSAEWSDEGILLEDWDRTGNRRRTFYGNGILKSEQTDTVIQQIYRVRRTSDYYPTGILRRVSYQYNNVDCMTWKEYDKAGRLVREMRHAPVESIQPVELYAEEFPEVMMYVEEAATYRGGAAAWRQELKQQLE